MSPGHSLKVPDCLNPNEFWQYPTEQQLWFQALTLLNLTIQLT
jgi:hypothetical protein